MKKGTGLIGSRPGPKAAERLRVYSVRPEDGWTDGQMDRRKEGRENMRGFDQGWR